METLSWKEVQQLPTFIINMDDCKDRYTITEERVKKAGYTSITRISAIDARIANLEEEWENHGTPPFKPSDHEFVKYKGKQCCLLSWLKTLEYIIEKNIEVSTIFEDDVLFHKDWEQLAPVFWEHTPKEFDFCYIGGQLDAPGQAPDISTLPTFCTHAIIFTLEGAKKVLEFVRRHPEGVFTIDCMIKEAAERMIMNPSYNPFTFYTWNATRFRDPAAIMPKDWTKRNCGLVFQDYDLGTFVREW